MKTKVERFYNILRSRGYNVKLLPEKNAIKFHNEIEALEASVNWICLCDFSIEIKNKTIFFKNIIQSEESDENVGKDVEIEEGSESLYEERESFYGIMSAFIFHLHENTNLSFKCKEDSENKIIIEGNTDFILNNFSHLNLNRDFIKIIKDKNKVIFKKISA
jgi:hypothetical protein